MPRGEYKAGHLIDTDIWFNPSVFFNMFPEDRDDLTDEQFQQQLPYPDIQAVFTHELGHVLGLRHTHLEEPNLAVFYHENPYQARGLDFDDRLSMKMNYPPGGGQWYFNRLTKSAISGRIINGDAVDNVDPVAPEIIPEIENQPVFVGRINNDGIISPDDRLGVDEATSFTNKIRLLAEVLNTPRFRVPGSTTGTNALFTAPVVYDNRYYIGGLPSSFDPLKIDDRMTIDPGDYMVYIEPSQLGASANDEAVLFYSPSADLVPAEFYGGTIPFIQPGAGGVPDPNIPNDRLIQDQYLQVGYNNLGQFSTRVAGSTYQLVEYDIVPIQGYTTYRVIQNGTTTDVINLNTAGLTPLAPVENDPENYVDTAAVVANTVLTTQTIQLGFFRPDIETTPSTARIQVEMKNITSGTIQAGIAIPYQADRGSDQHGFVPRRRRGP